MVAIERIDVMEARDGYVVGFWAWNDGGVTAQDLAIEGPLSKGARWS